jgi:hypothetical protein
MNEEQCVDALLATPYGPWSKNEHLDRLRELGKDACIVASVIGNYRSRWVLAFMDMEDDRLGGTMINMAKEMIGKSVQLDRLLKEMLLRIQIDIMNLEARFKKEAETNTVPVEEDIRAQSYVLIVKRKVQIEELLHKL